MKRRNAGLCAAILLLTTLTSNVPAMDTFAADRSADVRKLRDFLACKGELTADEAAQFDMNSDGKLNAVDLTLMKRDCLYPSEPDPVISAGTYEAESAYLTGGTKSPKTAVHRAERQSEALRMIQILSSLRFKYLLTASTSSF